MWVTLAKQCRLGLFQDSDFPRDLKDSKSTSGGTLCVLGSHTFVPTSWMFKKQTAISHNSTESEIVSFSTSASPVKRSYGSQDPWSSVAKKEQRSGRPDIGTDPLKASDHYYHEQFVESFSSASYSNCDDDRAWSSQEWETD